MDQIQKYAKTVVPDKKNLNYFKMEDTGTARLSEAVPYFLTAPATSVPSEWLFSHAGFQVKDRRNRLSGETTEAIMMVYENMNIFIHSEDDEDEE